jgi:hypothetical protein
MYLDEVLILCGVEYRNEYVKEGKGKGQLGGWNESGEGMLTKRVRMGARTGMDRFHHPILSFPIASAWQVMNGTVARGC